eukprot:sb/3463642/
MYQFPRVHRCYGLHSSVHNPFSPVPGYDEDNGNYIKTLNDHLVYRYQILDVIGKGSFGQVVKAYDHKNGGMVAIKIIRNKKRFHHQALVEVKLLDLLRRKDKENKYNLVHMGEYFYFRNHLCITFELLWINLYELLKRNNFQGFSMNLIRKFAYSMLLCLRMLHRLFYSTPFFTNVKEAPEVILGLPYTTAIDMWSFGCILAELHTGYPLFPGENETDQLSCIMEVFGMPPNNMIEEAKRKRVFFDSKGNYCPKLQTSKRKRRIGGKDSCEAKLLKPLQSGYSRMAQKRLCAYLIIQLSLDSDKIATSAWSQSILLLILHILVPSFLQIGRGHFGHFLHLGWSGRFFWCFWDPIGVQCKWKTFVMSQFTKCPQNDKKWDPAVRWTPDDALQHPWLKPIVPPNFLPISPTTSDNLPSVNPTQIVKKKVNEATYVLTSVLLDTPMVFFEPPPASPPTLQPSYPRHPGGTIPAAGSHYIRSHSVRSHSVAAGSGKGEVEDNGALPDSRRSGRSSAPPSVIGGTKVREYLSTRNRIIIFKRNSEGNINY